MARCYLHLWWYFLMQGNYTTWAKRGALDVKELMLKLWNCYVLSKRDDCQDFFILFHRPSWDHRSPFQAPVSPKGWPEITQLCKKTTIKDQGELPLQFPSEFIFEEKKCFAAWSKGTYNQLQRICGPFPRLQNHHMYIYLHCTMIWHWFSWWWKTMKNEEMALALIQSGDEMTTVLNCRCELAASPRRGALPAA